MFPIRVKVCSESDLRMLGSLARNIQRVLPVTQADIDAAAALGKGWVVWKVIEVSDPLDNLRGGTQLIIKQNSVQPGQNVRRVIFVSGPGGETVVIGPAPSPLLLPDAIANSLSYVKAFGGTEQRNLPAEYTQLEYIESTGTQLIDLGLKWTYGTSTKTVCEMLDRQSTAFGCVGARNSTTVVWGNYQSNTNSNFTCFGNIVNVTFSQNMVDGNYHTWEINNTGFYLDGVQKTDLSGSTQTLVSTDNIGLFGRYDGSGNIERCGKWRIKSHQTSVDNTLTQDLIPAKRNSDSVIGMYDTVSGTFFTNAGTGDFVAGPEVVPTPDAPMDIVSNNGVLKARHQSGLPLDYTLLDYIETDGASWFATGINVDATTELEITASDITSPGSQLMVARTISTGKYFRIAKATATQRLVGSVGPETITDSNNNGINKFTAKVNISGFYVDGTLIGNFADTTPDLSEITEVDIFKGTYGSNTYYAYAGSKLHRAIIRKNNIAVIDLIPCKNASNAIGMYDLVSGQFFTNAGTGTFTAGDPVSDPVEIYTDGTVETIEDTIGNTATAEMLLKVGDYQDVQEILAGDVTRKVGVKVLDGTENWTEKDQYNRVSIQITDMLNSTSPRTLPAFCNYFENLHNSESISTVTAGQFYLSAPQRVYFHINQSTTTAEQFKQWLAEQYANGTPVIVIYPLATPTTEVVAGQTLQVTQGDNTLEITQASMSGLELEAEYEQGVQASVEEIEP
jgi:hypothetical protein